MYMDSILYIPTNEGFANKVFNIIVCLYIQYILSKKKINISLVVIIQKSVHNKITDPTIDKILPNLKKHLTFIPENELPEYLSVKSRPHYISWTGKNRQMYYPNPDDKNFNGLVKLIKKTKHIFNHIVGCA